jgi:hypothetical protein
MNIRAIGLGLILVASIPLSHASEIPNFNIRMCSSDKKECYEIRAPLVDREEGQSVYTFHEAEMRILSKTQTGYKVLQIMKSNRGTLDLSRGVVSLNEDGATVEQNLRSGHRSRN